MVEHISCVQQSHFLFPFSFCVYINCYEYWVPRMKRKRPQNTDYICLCFGSIVIKFMKIFKNMCFYAGILKS
ncbi:hypothetical protein J3Q64DRAFT_1769753 [Phycomyces blakesleeanus]|uniref:Uncharacterized protein n=1 Tax=Phycomyces blakesleeanus TaxID=4837 RepID=A0ABR3ALQ8_PHYBL